MRCIETKDSEDQIKKVVVRKFSFCGNSSSIRNALMP